MINEYEMDARLLAANPVSEEQVKAQMSAPADDLVLREITQSGSPSLFSRLFSSLVPMNAPSPGRAGYLGALAIVAVVAIAVVGSLPFTLGQADEVADAPSLIEDQAEEAAPVEDTPTVSPAADGQGVSASSDVCEATGSNLDTAKQAYSEKCSQPRLDCDPLDGSWLCSSRQIGDAMPRSSQAAAKQQVIPLETPADNSLSTPQQTATSEVAAPGVAANPANPSSTSTPTTTPTSAATSTETTIQTPEPVPAQPQAPAQPQTPAQPQAPAQPSSCTASGSGLGQAKEAFEQQCSDFVRADCDPANGQWVCSSETIGASSPSGATKQPGKNQAVPTPAPNPGPAVGSSSGNCVTIEAESLNLVGAWNRRNDGGASGGSYITWEGLSTARNNNSPADTISASFTISAPGSYRFVWAMRQPNGVASDKANDSWVNFPDAARFGPVGGGSYNGFVKVFGNGKGNFAWKATADRHESKSAISIDFARSGTHTIQLAGRSHGHQIDKIVIFPASTSAADAAAGRCSQSGAAATPAPAATPTPTPAPTPAASNGPFDPSKDLLSLHYDHAPDRDDGHATVAGKVITDTYNLTPWVVGGAYGTNKNTYQKPSEAVMQATWGSGWYNAHANWNGAVTATANRWQQTLNSGGDIWVAEGGQSDLSADVVRELKRRNPNLNSKSRIHIVQHSPWNENHTTPADLNYVRASTDYVKINDGNNLNATANLNVKTAGWDKRALNSRWGSSWAAAFNYLNPNTKKLDFSDTVELLHILGIPKSQIANPNDFANRFFR